MTPTLLPSVVKNQATDGLVWRLLHLIIMKCCVCGEKVSPEQAKKYSVEVEHVRVATCSVDHQKEARKKPGICKLNSDTAVEIIPL